MNVVKTRNREKYGQVGRLILLVVALLCSAPSLFASALGQAGTPTGSASINICAGIGYSNNLTPGIPWDGNPSGGTNCSYSTGALVSQSAYATGSKAGNAFPYTDNASGSATPTQIHLGATHSGDSDYFFPEAYAEGGWNDIVTPNVVGIPGTAGVWVFGISVSGTITSTGPDAGAEGFVEVFQNGNDVQDYSTYFDAAYKKFAALNTISNGCIGPSWSQEMVGWGASSRNGSCGTVNANTTVWFALPVTIGASVNFGIWADISAGEGSAGQYPPNSPIDTASADLSHSILWGGPGYFIDGKGNVYNNVTLTSASGANYNVAATDTAATPEPSTAVLLLAGLAILWLRVRGVVAGRA